MLTDADRAFLTQHARDYARPDLDSGRADAYARWYLATYARWPDATMDDMPAHTSALAKFLDQVKDHTVIEFSDGEFSVMCPVHWEVARSGEAGAVQGAYEEHRDHRAVS